MSKKSTPAPSRWSAEVERLKDLDAQPPEGSQAIEDIAAELGMSPDNAKTYVMRLVKAERAEICKGKKRTAGGQLIPCMYYRLLEPA